MFGQRTHHATKQRKRAKDALLGGVADLSQLAAGDYLVHQRHGVGRYQGLKRARGRRRHDGARRAAARVRRRHALPAGLPARRGAALRRRRGPRAAARQARRRDVGGDAQQGRAPRPRARRGAAPALRAARRAARPSLPARRRHRSASSRRRSRSTRRPIRPAAIDAVLGDMEAPRAMDRLVCGDVGYGKTEVALRAIFRCVQGGKQAVVLAPTTVLVEQHFRTMAERFEGFARQRRQAVALPEQGRADRDRQEARRGRPRRRRRHAPPAVAPTCGSRTSACS